MSVLAATLSANAATIEGSVRDTNGKLAKGAEIRVERTDGGANLVTANTDNRGKYVLNGVNVGIYTVTAIAPSGAKSVIKNIRPKSGLSVRLEFDMRPSNAPDKVRQFVWIPAPTGTHLQGQWVEVTHGQVTDVAMQRVEKKTGRYLQTMQAREHRGRP